MGENEHFTEHIVNIRKRFSEFVNILIDDQQMNIEMRLNDYINEINNNSMNNSQIILLPYGGRAWNNIVYGDKFKHITSHFSEVQTISFLSGNYDFVIFSNSYIDISYFHNIINNFFITWVEPYIISKFDEMCNNKHINDKFDIKGKYTIINYYTGKEEDITCHTISCGYQYVLILQKNKDVVVDSNKELYIPNGDNNKTLIYFECSAFPINEFDRFKDNMSNNSFLSEYGLFLVSSFLLTDRTKEKGVSIDVIRNQFMDNHILPNLLAFHGLKHDKESFITSVFLERLHLFFITKPKDAFLLTNTNNEDQKLYELQQKEPTSHGFYKKKQSDLMLQSFKKYNATIIDNNNNEFPFNEWFQRFNDELLDSPRGGSHNNFEPYDYSFPSFRQLINWILILFYKYNISNLLNVRFEKSGGDALRYYLPEIIHTSDIDTKLFYTSTKSFLNIQDKIILLIVFLMEYMETNKYFRFAISRKVEFGQYEFDLKFDTHSQENVLSCRYLRDFAVPLLSIDLRLNYSITLISISIRGHDNYNLNFSSKYDNAILDVGFNKSNKEIIAEKNKFNREVQVSQYPYHSGINFTDNPDFFQLAPLPTIDYLIKDIEGMYSNLKNREARIASGKREKDFSRFNMLNEIKKLNKQPQLSPDNIRMLDQLTDVPDNFINNKNNFVYCCGTILNNDIMQLNDITKYVFNYETIITELNKYIPNNLGEDIILFAMYLRDAQIKNKKLTFSKDKRENIKNETFADVNIKNKKISDATQDAQTRKQSLRRKNRGGKRSTSKNKKQGNYKQMKISRNKYIKLKKSKKLHY
jgi:hypothetical protein